MLKKYLIGVVLFLAVLANPLLSKEFTMAIVDFANVSNDSNYNCYKTGIPEILVTDLAMSKQIKIAERTKLQKIIEEMKLSVSGLIDEKKSVEIGKMAGANIILTGAIIKDSEKIRVDSRLIDVESGLVLVSETVSCTDNSEMVDAVDLLAEKIIKSLTGEVIKIAENNSNYIPSFNGKILAMETMLSNQYKLNGLAEDMYMSVEIYALKADVKKRIPLNLSIVIDRSGSMNSQSKLETAKRTAQFIINNLNEKDFVSVVTYDDTVQVVVPSQPVTNREAVKQKIAEIYTGGSTNLCGGIEEGFKQVAVNFKQGQVNRVLLLSDGLANVGIQSKEGIEQVVTEKSKGGISLSTFGVGTDYNENLMVAISTRAAGNYYFIAGAEKINEVFFKELKGLLAVVAQKTSVEFELADDVEVKEIYGYLLEKNGRKVTVKLGDVFSGEKKRLFVRLGVPANFGGTLNAVKVACSYDDVVNDKAGQAERAELKVQYTGDSNLVKQNTNAMVMKDIPVFESARVTNDAIQLAYQGKADAAKSSVSKNQEEMKETFKLYNNKAAKVQFLNMSQYNDQLKDFEKKDEKVRKEEQKSQHENQYKMMQSK